MGDHVKGLQDSPRVPLSCSCMTVSIAFNVTCSMLFDHVMSVPEVEDVRPLQGACLMCA